MNTAQTLLIPFEETNFVSGFKERIARLSNIRKILQQICNLNSIVLDDKLEITNQHVIMCKAKPFVKWAGGKGLLLPQLEGLLPPNFDKLQNVTYVEPFVGGGAMLFHMLRNHPNITRAVINDINPDLIHCYELIAHHPDRLIARLRELENNYYSVSNVSARRELYYAYRDQFNQEGIGPDERAAIFIFLNHTCYNGLYRVNARGKFNVPCGRYKRPLICNEELIIKNHELLNSIDLVICKPGDYQQVLKRISRNHPNFVYFDPPYDSDTSTFNSYTEDGFNKDEQRRLAQVFKDLDKRGVKVMLSNHNTTLINELYKEYNIHIIEAKRSINSKGNKRGNVEEVIITNY